VSGKNAACRDPVRQAFRYGHSCNELNANADAHLTTRTRKIFPRNWPDVAPKSLPQLLFRVQNRTILAMGLPVSATASYPGPFHSGSMVVVTLANPREKFWGALLGLRPEGISIRGIELASFEDLVTLVKEGEAFALGVVFFPLHRLERMELDLPDGNIPSLAQRFVTKTGKDPASLLGAGEASPPSEQFA